MKTNLPKRLVSALPYMILIFGAYSALPFAAIALGSSRLYIVGVPLLDCCIVCAAGFFYGKKHQRDPLLPAVCAVLFIPVMFFFYNLSAWIYLLLLPLFAFFGQCMGTLYRKR